MSWLDGITNSMEMDLSKLQEMVKTGKPGVLQSMWSQRVGHDLATEQQHGNTKKSHTSLQVLGWSQCANLEASQL